MLCPDGSPIYPNPEVVWMISLVGCACLWCVVALGASWLERRQEEQARLGYKDQPYVVIIGGGQVRV